jgi:hypothetical protein
MNNLVGAGLVPARISEADNQAALSFKIESIVG